MHSFVTSARFAAKGRLWTEAIRISVVRDSVGTPGDKVPEVLRLAGTGAHGGGGSLAPTHYNSTHEHRQALRWLLDERAGGEAGTWSPSRGGRAGSGQSA